MEVLRPEHIDSKKYLDAFIKNCLKHQIGFAIWRLPNSEIVEIRADLNGGEELSTIEFDDLSAGFLISPYNEDENAVFLREDVIASIPIEIKSANKYRLSNAIDWKKNPSSFEEMMEKSSDDFDKNNLQRDHSMIETKADEFKNVVAESVDKIREGYFEKVVPSKIKIKNFEEFPDLIDAFIKSCQKYPSAFTSIHFSKFSGLWFGASPETLIEHEEDKFFKTVALAGTQALREGQSVKSVSWTQKEIEEQAYVSRYIINCFKKIRLREFKEIGPKTVQAGNLLHLKTFFEIDLTEINFPELPAVMLKLLHPTSAVCGMPKAAAQAFLQNKEKHRRALFSGYIGPIKQLNHSHLFVNLRCCQVLADQVVFYAGAGVTEDSNPEKEWEETEMKCKILSSILFPESSLP